MEEIKASVLKEWLEIDFYRTANKIGFSDSTKYVSEELVVQSIRCLDYETSVVEHPSVNYVITIIALMWEHTDKQAYDLRKIIVKFLSRIGYPTSAIIADKEFDQENCVFSSLESPLEHIYATLNQENNSVDVCGHKYLLTKFQMDIWNSMDKEKLIGISAPTSAGKSFVILLKLLAKLCKERFDIVYIVPTLSLLNQVAEDFNKNINLLDIPNCLVSSSFVEKDNETQNNIYVLTQEKAIAAFSDKRNVFLRPMVLVADEIQNIERIKEDADERAKVLFDTLNEFRYKENVNQIIISGPRIDDIERTGKNLFGLRTKDITTFDSPVLNLTYSVYRYGGKYYLKQYCTLTKYPIVKQIDNSNAIQGYGKTSYDEAYLNYLNGFVQHFEGQQNIIFSPTAPTARKIACSLQGNERGDHDIQELVEYYKCSIHPQYSMCKTLVRGIAYHHGKLPDHVRRTIEKAIHNKSVSSIVCTTTLLQGVNLPTQNIIIRNPHLFIRQNANSAKLSNYEMANLRGRAGRLLKDFVGRTFVLDETSFAETDGYDQITIFEDATKELPDGYGERFEKHQEDIESVVSTTKPVDNNMSQYGDLVAYIRQSVLRYGSEAKQKMQNVGVKLTKEQVAAIILKLDELSVPKDICYKNRYWDPFILDVIYTKYPEGVPAHPLERGAKAKLDRMLKFLRDTPETKMMYEKHIPREYRENIGRGILKDLCMTWAKETSLSDILSNINGSEDEIADKIEDVIEVLQNTVSYRVPLLLKPIFDIKNPESVFLPCMQSGAYNKVTKLLIEIGVPRECAIYLNNSLFCSYDSNNKADEEIESDIRKILKNNITMLPYWISVQLEFLG